MPEIVERAALGACREIGIEPSAVDVGSIGAACNVSLNEQGLLAGLLAGVPGLEGKPIESVENACASGGQAVLSVIQKLQLGMGEIGHRRRLREDARRQGKMDGKLVGKVLGYFSHPDERAGQGLRLPAPLRRGDGGIHEGARRHRAATSPTIAVQEYRNAQFNPYAQMRDVELTLEKACNASKASTATSSTACR